MNGSDFRNERIGPLDCLLYGPENPEAVRLTVVLCHGFGAPGTDLAGLAPELVQRAPELNGTVEWVFPAAPMTLAHLGYGPGRAWWMLDIEAMQQALVTEGPGHRRRECPEGLQTARSAVDAMLKTLLDRPGRDPSSLYLGGFSQGAMVTTDAALRLSEPCAGLCIMSGTLINEPQWQEQASRGIRFPVLQSHGRQDPILPFSEAVGLRDLLMESGFPVEFLPFEGPHTIPIEVLDALTDQLVRSLAPS